MGKSKIIFNGQTLIDLTGDTVTADTLLEGITAHGADGEAILGVMKAAAGGGVTVLSGTVTPTSANAAALNVPLPEANFTLLFMAPDSADGMSSAGATTKVTSLIHISNNAGNDVYWHTWKSTDNNTSKHSRIDIDHENGTVKVVYSGMFGESTDCFVSGSTYRWYYAYG